VIKHGTLGRGELSRSAEIEKAPFESNHIRFIEAQGGPCRIGDGVKGRGKRGCGVLVAEGRELRGKRWAFIIVVVVMVASAAPSSAGIVVVYYSNRCSLLLTAFCCILVHFNAFNKISLHSILMHF